MSNDTKTIAALVDIIRTGITREWNDESLARDILDAICSGAVPLPEDVAIPTKVVTEFQDKVREQLLDELAAGGLEGADIDGGGCDSGDWRDFTLSEIRQAFTVLADFYYDANQALEERAADAEGQLFSVKYELEEAVNTIVNLKRRETP